MLTLEQFQSFYETDSASLYVLFVQLHQTCDALQLQTLEVLQLERDLRRQNEELKQRVKSLEDRLNKDSHNSSKPPSSDGFSKRPKSLRTKSGRPSGGQKGHPGHTLEYADNPDTVIMHVPGRCAHCRASLKHAPVTGYERRQEFDLPRIRLMVTEHRAEARCCLKCGRESVCEFPEGLGSPTQYGPVIKGLATYLQHFQLLPYSRLASLLADLFGATISEGTLASFAQQAYDRLRSTEANIHEALCKGEVVHFDETGVAIAGKLNWQHVASTTELTYYACHPKRGAAAMQKIGILARLRGRAVHDGLGAYNQFQSKHALCNAHHLRELIGLEERYAQPWTTRMKELLLEIKKAVDHAKSNGKCRMGASAQAEFMRRYAEIVEEGYQANPPIAPPTGKRGRPRQGPVRSLLLRLDKRRDDVYAFMTDFRVPFDNNLAERDLRMMKVKQKVSGCFRSEAGAKAFCRIRGYISTMRKQGHDVLAAIESVFSNSPLQPAGIATPE